MALQGAVGWPVVTSPRGFGVEITLCVGTAGPCATPSLSRGWKAGRQRVTVNLVSLPHSWQLWAFTEGQGRVWAVVVPTCGNTYKFLHRQ